MVHLCSELVRNDGNFRTRERIRQDLVDAVAQLREIHEAVKYGSEKYGTPGSVGTSQRQDDLLFVPRCAATDDMKCMSLDTLMSLFLDKVRDFTSVADSSLSYGSVEYASIVDVESKHMGNLLSVSKDFYVSDSLPVIEATRSNMAYVFGFSFPALIGLYLFLVHSMLSRVEKEVRRSRRMLSMVPVDVIASISAIEQFVRSHGKQDGTREALANAVKDSQLKTRSVLAASVDAVIEFNCEGRIVSLNPSAEKMFICKAASAVGEDIAMFFPSSELVPVSGHAMAITGDSTEEVNPEQALRGHMSLLLHRCRNSEDGSCEGVVWETMVARSDSETFPAQVSLCVGRTQGEVYFAAFIRDLSVLKKQESLLRLEREKSEKLLSTILPKSIAARLKASEGHVVDVYDSVSVVFTDIVKFTETASRMTPQAVVGMLSDLFSEMDSLASKHGVEKIKTLGDGWLGCAGLFGRYHDHSLACVEWGRDVLAFLRMYNAEHGTNIMFRIGIATGPVTAGVIGTSRLQFDIFGDTVNLASRMESTSLPGRINLSREVYERIYDKVLCEERTVEVKGKGLMQTFLVTQ
jgi:class 3 adenylate cyclase